MVFTVVILFLTVAIGSWLLWQWWVGALAGPVAEGRRVSQSAPTPPATSKPAVIPPLAHRTRPPSRFRFPFQAA